MLTPHLGWQGHVTVWDVQPSKQLRALASFPNLITDAGLDLLVQGLAGSSAAIGYLAVGSGTTPATTSDRQLATEFARYPIQRRTPTSVGKLVTRAYLTDAQALGTIRELGWFGGSAATSTPGSGVLLARVLYDHTKGDTESLVIDRTDTIVRS